MNSYGVLDNEPVVGSKAILTNLLRGEMGFDGVTVSDYGAVQQMQDKDVVSDELQAGVKALKAGLHIECPSATAYLHLEEALEQQLISLDQIDKAVKNILTVKFRLGLFENPYPRTDLLEDAYQNEKNRKHSLTLARKSTVLLKNDGILPLSKDIKQIAVIGPRGSSIRMQYGGYTFPAGLEMAMGGLLKHSGIEIGGESDSYYPNSTVKKESEQLGQMLKGILGDQTPTIVDAVKAKCPNSDVLFEKGCDIAGDDRNGIDSALVLAKESDVVLLAIGGKYGWGEPCTAGEGRDTTDIGLPGIQEELLQSIIGTGTPVVIIHGDVRPLSSRYAKEHANAIIETWCPGLTGGTAVMDVIFGDYNPAGRLSVTALEHAGQVPIYNGQKKGNLLSMNQEAGNFNSFSNGVQRPLWYFGEGLSYSQFEYSDFKVEKSVDAVGEIHLSVVVKNIGKMDGEEVVQLYFTDEIASMVRPMKELAGFVRVPLKAGEEKIIHFTMKASQSAFLDEDMQWKVEEGKLKFYVGSSSVDERETAECYINNTRIIDGKDRGFYASVSY